MKKAIYFIDGFNLYHALQAYNAYHKYKWLDLSKLPRHFRPGFQTKDIFYFTALASWNPDKVKRHRLYIRALESKSVKIVYGEFRKRTHTCRYCRRDFDTFEEKQTDVNIAIWLLKLAFEDQYDLAMIVSGDSDLIPSIRAVKTAFPSKEIGIVIPIGRRAEELKQTADFYMKMKEKHLKACLLEPVVDLGSEKLTCPPSWS
jgi:uncharacterized LabA/DUF88 family protein